MVKKVGKYTLPAYSVLMSVYDRELPENLNESLESMLMQSYPPTELVLVCDGKLTNELDVIVKSFQNEYKRIFRIVRIDENVGVGKALNEGIAACRCEFIVRMDSDDISFQHRCLKQMLLFAVKPTLDIVGSFVEEFDQDAGRPNGIRQVPIMHKDIMEYARRRSPFNRQSVAFRRSAAMECGGYSTELRYCEDYEFVVRMLASGARGQNIPEPLVRFRVNSKTPELRKSWALTKAFIKVRWVIFTSGYTSFNDFLVPCVVQLLLFVLPHRFTHWFYNTFLRKNEARRRKKRRKRRGLKKGRKKGSADTGL